MTEQLYDETGQPIDADGRLADPVTDGIAESVAEYFPAFIFDKKNVRASFDQVIEAENDPKIKGLLMLIQGLYLARKQHADELNVAFYRIYNLGQSLERGHKNIDISFANEKLLHTNDQNIVNSMMQIYDTFQKDSKKTKVAIGNLRKFRKRHEPRLKRLAKYIDANADKFNEEKKKFR